MVNPRCQCYICAIECWARGAGRSYAQPRSRPNGAPAIPVPDTPGGGKRRRRSDGAGVAGAGWGGVGVGRGGGVRVVGRTRVVVCGWEPSAAFSDDRGPACDVLWQPRLTATIPGGPGLSRSCARAPGQLREGRGRARSARVCGCFGGSRARSARVCDAFDAVEGEERPSMGCI